MMRSIGGLFMVICCVAFAKPVRSQELNKDEAPVYEAKKVSAQLRIDGKWNKKAWKGVKSAEITHFIRAVPAFHPVTQVKLQYDEENIYVIFRVKDRYVRCITNKPNGPVWKDAAVEFFFCPDTTMPTQYFNLEINCGGTALLGYRSQKPTVEDLKTIVIAHSLPTIVDPEITEPVVWTLEYKIPLSTLEKYSRITRPAKGVRWKANFCKIAENNSNPHHMTWSPINAPNPNFHMPQFFGTLEFQ